MTTATSYDPVPLVLTLLLFVILCLAFGFLFLQYRATQRDLEFCRSVRLLQTRAEQTLQR